MEITELIKSRRAVRKYQNKMPEDVLIRSVIEAGVWAPSSLNRQPWRFIAVTDPEKRELLVKEAERFLSEFCDTDEAYKKWGDAVPRLKKRAEAEGDSLFYYAPVLIFVIRTKDYDGADFDLGLAAQSMMLAAHGQGLATCPIGLAEPLDRSDAAREILGLKSGEYIRIALCLGYPDEQPEGRGRDVEGVAVIV